MPWQDGGHLVIVLVAKFQIEEKNPHKDKWNLLLVYTSSIAWTQTKPGLDQDCPVTTIAWTRTGPGLSHHHHV